SLRSARSPTEECLARFALLLRRRDQETQMSRTIVAARNHDAFGQSKRPSPNRQNGALNKSARILAFAIAPKEHGTVQIGRWRLQYQRGRQLHPAPAGRGVSLEHSSRRRSKSILQAHR